MQTISENDAIYLIKSNDLSQLLIALRSPNNYLPIYDALCQAPIELPYCLFKAWNTYVGIHTIVAHTCFLQKHLIIADLGTNTYLKLFLNSSPTIATIRQPLQFQNLS